MKKNAVNSVQSYFAATIQHHFLSIMAKLCCNLYIPPVPDTVYRSHVNRCTGWLQTWTTCRWKTVNAGWWSMTGPMERHHHHYGVTPSGIMGLTGSVLNLSSLFWIGGSFWSW